MIAWFAVFICAGALAAEPPVLEFSVERFDVSGDNPLDPVATEDALAPFTGARSWTRKKAKRMRTRRGYVPDWKVGNAIVRRY